MLVLALSWITVIGVCLNLCLVVCGFYLLFPGVCFVCLLCLWAVAYHLILSCCLIIGLLVGCLMCY